MSGFFASPLYAGFYTDPEISTLFDAAAEIGSWLRFEAALANAEADAGVIPAEAARRIADVCSTVSIDPARIAKGVRHDGIPIPAFVEALREAVGGEDASWVHWGVTTHDVIDTGLVLRLRDAADRIDWRLETIGARLETLAREHVETPLAGRTWGQHATPTSFGLKVAGWRAPLVRHRRRLAEMRPRTEILAFGGASGTLSAVGPNALAVEAALARTLGLSVTPVPWHAQRDGIGELVSLLDLIGASLAKIARDVSVLSQTELGEVRESGGGSSTMPQKTNPVRANAIQALARTAHGAATALRISAAPENERDPSQWMVEWAALPILFDAIGGALALSEAMLADITVDPGRMRANLDAAQGLILAEAASFALSRHMPRTDAIGLVKDACRVAIDQDRHLIDILAERTDAPVDWTALRDPARQTGLAVELVERALRER